MIIDFAFICDYAEVAQKINAMGIGFDTIFAPQVPTRHPLFFLVFQLRASTVEAGEKDFSVSIIDEDGGDTMPEIKGKFSVPKPVSGTESKARVAMQFAGVEFKAYGLYSIHVVVAGNDMISIPLRISAPPPKPQQV